MDLNTRLDIFQRYKSAAWEHKLEPPEPTLSVNELEKKIPIPESFESEVEAAKHRDPESITH